MFMFAPYGSWEIGGSLRYGRRVWERFYISLSTFRKMFTVLLTCSKFLLSGIHILRRIGSKPSYSISWRVWLRTHSTRARAEPWEANFWNNQVAFDKYICTYVEERLVRIPLVLGIREERFHNNLSWNDFS